MDSSTYYTAFTEGWALYAENPLIARETNVYDEVPFQKYGMLKWQVWIRQTFCLRGSGKRQIHPFNLVLVHFPFFFFQLEVIVLQRVAKIMIMIIIMITMKLMIVMIMKLMIKGHYN